MLPIRRILFPIDFSPRSHGTAAYVEAMVGRFEAELILLHVIEPPTYNSLLNRAQTVPAITFDEFFGPDIKFLNVQRIVEKGDPAQKIEETATRLKADLIMLPTQGLGTFRRLLIGSTAAKVLHDAECPVWTGVHLEDAPAVSSIQCRHIVCALDLKSNPRVLSWAKLLAEEYQASLTLVHAAHCSHAVVQAALDSLQSQCGSHAEVRIEDGDPTKVVPHLAAELHADLLVIGRRGTNGLIGRLEMTSYSIIRQSPCPVLSV